MVCKTCGLFLDDTISYCGKCGTKQVPLPVPDRDPELLDVHHDPIKAQKKSKFKLITVGFLIILIVLIILNVIMLFNPTHLEGLLYRFNIISEQSPINSAIDKDVLFRRSDDPIKYYIKALKSNNWKGIFESCANEEITEQYNFLKMIKRNNYYDVMQFNTLYPNEFDFYAQANGIVLMNDIVRKSVIAAIMLAGSDDMDNDRLFRERQLGEESMVYLEQLIPSIDPSKLKSVEIVEIIPATDYFDNWYDDRHQDNRDKIMRIYGAMDYMEYLVVLEINQNQYMVGFEVYNFDGNWKILSLNAPYAGIGVISKMTDDEVEVFTRFD